MPRKQTQRAERRQRASNRAQRRQRARELQRNLAEREGIDQGEVTTQQQLGEQTTTRVSEAAEAEIARARAQGSELLQSEDLAVDDSGPGAATRIAESGQERVADRVEARTAAESPVVLPDDVEAQVGAAGIQGVNVDEQAVEQRQQTIQELQQVAFTLEPEASPSNVTLSDINRQLRPGNVDVINVGNRSVLNFRDRTGISPTFDDPSELAEFRQSISDLPRDLRQEITLAELGQDPELFESAQARAARFEARQELDRQLSDADVNPDSRDVRVGERGPAGVVLAGEGGRTVVGESLNEALQRDALQSNRVVEGSREAALERGLVERPEQQTTGRSGTTDPEQRLAEQFAAGELEDSGVDENLAQRISPDDVRVQETEGQQRRVGLRPDARQRLARQDAAASLREQTGRDITPDDVVLDSQPGEEEFQARLEEERQAQIAAADINEQFPSVEIGTDDIQRSGDEFTLSAEAERQVATQRLDAQLEDTDITPDDLERTADGQFQVEVQRRPDVVEALGVDPDAEPGRAAEIAADVGQTLREASPALGAALGVTAASLRTEEGLPTGVDGVRLPGSEDVQDATETLEPARRRIDEEIEAGVSAVGARIDAALPDVSLTRAAEVSTQTGSAAPLAAAAIGGTQVGREGVERGIETGLQTLNPAAATQDAIQFSDLGVRAADQVTSEGAASDIQTAIDVSEAGAELAREAGPAAATGAAIRDPAAAVAAPVAAGTALVGGAAVGTAAFGAGRAGARGASRVASELPDAATRAARRTRRDLTDIDVSLERDPSAGRVEIDNAPARQAIRNVGSNTTDRVGAGVRRTLQRQQQRLARVRRDVTPGGGMTDGPGSLRADARFVAEEGLGIAEESLRRGRRNAAEAVGRLRDLPTDARFSAEQVAGRTSELAGEIGQTIRSATSRASNPSRVRRDLGIAAERVRRAPPSVRADVRFSAEEALRRGRQRARGALERDQGSGGASFRSDTSTGRVQPLAVVDEAIRRGRSVDSEFLSDTATGRVQPLAVVDDAIARGRQAGSRIREGTPGRPSVDSPLLADTGTGRADPLAVLRAPERLSELNEPGDLVTSRGTFGRPLRADQPVSDRILSAAALPSREDLSGGVSGVSPQAAVNQRLAAARETLSDVNDLTLRIDTGPDRRRVVDVEDLEGPDPSAGVPDASGAASPDPLDLEPVSGPDDAQIDVGGGQVAQLRRLVEEEQTPRVGTDTVQRASELPETAPALVGATAGAQTPVDRLAAAMEPAVETDTATATGVDRAAATAPTVDLTPTLAEATDIGATIEAEEQLTPAETSATTVTGPTDVVGTGEAVGEMTVTTTDTQTQLEQGFRGEQIGGNFRTEFDLDIPDPDEGSEDDPFRFGVDEAEEVFRNAIASVEETEDNFEEFFGR